MSESQHNTKKIIEIGGVKLEIDMRCAKQIDTYRIGDNVKILVKEYKDYTPYSGVIVGFDNFVNRPAITVAYLKDDYSGASIKFKTITSSTDDTEICPMLDDALVFDKSRIIDLFDRQILKKEEDLANAKRQKSYFLEQFGRYFSEVAE